MEAVSRGEGEQVPLGSETLTGRELPIAEPVPLRHRKRRAKLDRQLLASWEVMLFAADFAVIQGRHLEQFEAAVGGEEAALIAQGLHFGRG